MDLSQIALNHGLTFLAWSTGIVIIIVAGFLVKLLIDLSKLSKNLNETTLILNAELKPTLETLSETLKTINELIKTTDQGFENAKLTIEKLLDKTRIFSKNIFGSFLKGFLTVVGIFTKK